MLPVYLVPMELEEDIRSPRTRIISGQDGMWVLNIELSAPVR